MNKCKKNGDQEMFSVHYGCIPAPTIKEMEKMPNEKKEDRKELHPNHYSGLYECWEIMNYLLSRKPFLTPFQGYLYGCAFKYSWRMGEKKNVDIIQDLDKQINYLEKMKEDILKNREEKNGLNGDQGTAQEREKL